MCKLVVDHVVEDQPAVGVDGGVDVLARTQGRDDQRNLVADAGLQVVHQAVVGPVHDLVHRKRRGRRLGVRSVMLGQRGLDLDEPLFQLLLRPRVEGGEGADDAALALGDDQFRVGDDEQRGADARQPQPPAQPLSQGRSGRHGGRLSRNSAPGAGLFAARRCEAVVPCEADNVGPKGGLLGGRRVPGASGWGVAHGAGDGVSWRRQLRPGLRRRRHRAPCEPRSDAATLPAGWRGGRAGRHNLRSVGRGGRRRTGRRHRSRPRAPGAARARGLGPTTTCPGVARARAKDHRRAGISRLLRPGPLPRCHGDGGQRGRLLRTPV
mmetsp:Transcript_19608/g.61606  ORF Transcript_19608/g.61606 Transcript_19608/m.61606 type:complete len:323 (+) Transcript_19608:772-1740(+)